MARKSRAQKKTNFRRTRRRRFAGGRHPIANVQFNNKAELLSHNPFNMILEFNSGSVIYGDTKIGTYEDKLNDGYYTIEPFNVHVGLYGRPLTETELNAHKQATVTNKKSSYYSRMKDKLITPRPYSVKDQPQYTSFSTSSSSNKHA